MNPVHKKNWGEKTTKEQPVHFRRQTSTCPFRHATGSTAYKGQPFNMAYQKGQDEAFGGLEDIPRKHHARQNNLPIQSHTL